MKLSRALRQAGQSLASSRKERCLAVGTASFLVCIRVWGPGQGEDVQSCHSITTVLEDGEKGEYSRSLNEARESAEEGSKMILKEDVQASSEPKGAASGLGCPGDDPGQECGVESKKELSLTVGGAGL